MLYKMITMQSPLNVSNPSEKEVIWWDHDTIPKICSNEPGFFKKKIDRKIMLSSDHLPKQIS